MDTSERYRLVIDTFEQTMPDPHTELDYGSPFQFLVAVILSAQCTDKRVNTITPALFRRYPTATDLAAADRDELFELIRSCSYPNNKTTSLLGMAHAVTERFGGNIPDNIDDLMSLPGVGRKSANVILSVIYDKPAMAVDTHVFRVAERIGFTTGSKSPLATEQALVANIPSDKIARAHHWLILHGRYVCKARRPLCYECAIRPFCRHYSDSIS